LLTFALGEQFRGSFNIGRLNLPPCAVTNREYPDRLSAFIDFINDAINARLLAARRTKRSRSALVRDALRERLRRLEIRDREERDRAGYSKQRQSRDEVSAWEAEAVWPAQ
jgi:hypothetical protein